MAAHDPINDNYPYDAEWLSVVDRNGSEWRAYCEGRACVKRFLRTEHLEGRIAACQEWKQHLEAVAEKRGAKATERLKADFELIGAHEGPDIRAQVEATVQGEWQAQSASAVA